MSDYFRLTLPVLEANGSPRASLGSKAVERPREVDHEQEYLDSQLRLMRGEREPAARNAPYLRYLAHLASHIMM